MVTKIGVGSSSVADSYKAGKEAAEKAAKVLKGEKGDFALIFTVAKYKQEEALRGINEVLGDIPKGGCCGTGVLTQEEGMKSDSVAVLVGKSDELSVTFGIGEGVSKNPAAAGEALARSLSSAKMDLNSVLIALPDGITGNCVSVVRGIFNILGSRIRYSGGGAGDNLRFVETFQFIDHQVLKDAVVGALFSSKKKIGVGIRHGWRAIGRPVIVTKSTVNVVNQLEGRPAFEVYQGICPGVTRENFAEFSMTHPLGIPLLGEEYLIRDPLKVLDDGSIFCVAEVPEKSVVRVMEGSKDSIIEATRKAAEEAIAGLGGAEPAAVLVFDCVSLTLILKEDLPKQIKGAIQSVIGEKTPMIGFYTFGEVGAIAGGPPLFHNKTVGIVAIGR